MRTNSFNRSKESGSEAGCGGRGVVALLRARGGGVAEFLLLGTSLGVLDVSILLFFAIVTSEICVDERGRFFRSRILSETSGRKNHTPFTSGKAVTLDLFLEQELQSGLRSKKFARC